MSLIRFLPALTALLVGAVLFCVQASAQVATTLSPNPIQHFVDNNGNPLSGGKLFTYLAGTTTKAATYTTEIGTTPNPNPIILNTRGEAPVWLNSSVSYKFVLSPSTDSDPPTNPIWTVDQINAPATTVGINPQQYGCVGDGLTNDTTCLQAAISGSISLGVPLRFDCSHKYFIVATLIASGNFADLEGCGNMGRLGFTNNILCPSGIIVNSNIDAIHFQVYSGTIQNICIQMGTTDGARSGGTAIVLGNTGGNSQTGVHVFGNTIFQPYQGIDMECTAGLTTASVTLRDNVIRGSDNYGICMGLAATGDSPDSITMSNNAIACSNASGNSSIGFLMASGDVDYDGTNVGPGDCFIGTKIAPGAGQNVGGHFRGVLGDSSGTHTTVGTPHDLWITTGAANATIGFLHFGDAWASGGVFPNGDVPVRIDNAGGGAVTSIEFVGLVSRTAGTSTVFDIEGNIFNFMLTDSRLCAWNNGTVINGLVMNFNGTIPEGHYVVTGNQIGSCLDHTGSSMTNGIIFNPGAGTGGSNNYTLIAANDLSSTTNPITYNPAAQTTTNNDVIIRHNVGVDDVLPAVTSATNLFLPNSSNPTYQVVGGANVATLGPAWQNREVYLFAATNNLVINGGTGLLPGTQGQNCSTNTYTVIPGNVILAHWNTVGSCWAYIQ